MYATINQQTYNDVLAFPLWVIPWYNKEVKPLLLFSSEITLSRVFCPSLPTYLPTYRWLPSFAHTNHPIVRLSMMVVYPFAELFSSSPEIGAVSRQKHHFKQFIFRECALGHYCKTLS